MAGFRTFSLSCHSCQTELTTWKEVIRIADERFNNNGVVIGGSNVHPECQTNEAEKRAKEKFRNYVKIIMSQLCQHCDNNDGLQLLVVSS